MTLRTALAQGTKLLEDGAIDAPRLTAEVLLAHALRVERVYLIAHAGDELSELGWIHYGRYLHQRLRRVPTQYITNRQEFYGREYHVAPGVLVPRPETELLVEVVLPFITPASTVLDIGTGSGCIAVTLALESTARVFASDISIDALRIARRNGALNTALCDLGSAFPSGSFDIVVSNPPYVPAGDVLAPEVRDNEPAQALFSGADGLDAIRRLIPEAQRLLKPGGVLAFEFGFGQSAAIRALLPTATIMPDLAGIDRVAVLRTS
ncbi:MAG: peptide chain release factor N(5)-glutamine methyltransferase [Acidobacteria bacterium]|nr:peptide chain release factor N(5)-glutamine methyltransferase [Acidobacteriota bacterium]